MSKGIEEVQILIITFIVFLFFSISLVYADNNSNSDEKESEEKQTTIFHYQEKESPTQEEKITTFRYPKEKPGNPYSRIFRANALCEVIWFQRIFKGELKEEGNGWVIKPMGIRIIYENSDFALNAKFSPYFNTAPNWERNWLGESYFVNGENTLNLYIHFSFFGFIRFIEYHWDRVLWIGGGFELVSPTFKTVINIPIRNYRFQVMFDIIYKHRLNRGNAYAILLNCERSQLMKRRFIWGINGGIIFPRSAIYISESKSFKYEYLK